MSTPLDLIIDCDPGIDDALALLLALAAPEKLRLLGITCVAGNRPVDTTADNASRLVAAAGRPDVPVYRGAAHPLDQAQARCNLVHGEDGLGGVVLPEGAGLADESAVDFLIRNLEQAPQDTLTIAAIGPLTNLALVDARRPGLLARAKVLAVMGGAVCCPGNVNPHAEFNFYADPAAAKQVLAAGARVQLFGLDVTSKAVMSDTWIAALAHQPGHCARLAHQMLVAYAALDPLLHDACPIAWLLCPELFTSSRWQLSVDDDAGPTAGRVSGRPSDQVADDTVPRLVCNGDTMVSFDVDNDSLLKMLFERLAHLP